MFVVTPVEVKYRLLFLRGSNALEMEGGATKAFSRASNCR
jgi:hypothetical protein